MNALSVRHCSPNLHRFCWISECGQKKAGSPPLHTPMEPWYFYMGRTRQLNEPLEVWVYNFEGGTTCFLSTFSVHNINRKSSIINESRLSPQESSWSPQISVRWCFRGCRIWSWRLSLFHADLSMLYIMLCQAFRYAFSCSKCNIQNGNDTVTATPDRIERLRVWSAGFIEMTACK